MNKKWLLQIANFVLYWQCWSTLVHSATLLCTLAMNRNGKHSHGLFWKEKLQARIQGRWNGWIFTPPPFFWIMLVHRPQTPQTGFGSITLLQKFTPPPPSPFQNPGSAPELPLQIGVLFFFLRSLITVSSYFNPSLTLWWSNIRCWATLCQIMLHVATIMVDHMLPCKELVVILFM